MPKFIVERRYLLPVYQRLIIEAPSLGAACEAATGNSYNWDTAENDGDGAAPTTITAAKIVPSVREEELEFANYRILGSFLYENEAANGALLTIPARYRAVAC